MFLDESKESLLNSTYGCILIVTVTKAEALAILEVFIGKDVNSWKRIIVGKKIYYDLGRIEDTPIFMVQSEMGIATPSGSLLTIQRAIQDLQPQAVIMCGIGFGLHPERQQLGDILISKQLHYYEPSKIDDSKGFLDRGDRVMASERLLDRFRSGDITWQGEKTHFGIVLSGEKLVNSELYLDWLRKNEPEAIGGEMEGAGLYAAARDAKVDWILVKAICDWADGKKNDDFQSLAAHNAANFVLHVLNLGGWSIRNEKNHRTLILDLSDVSSILDLSPSSVEKLIVSEKLPALKDRHGDYKISVKELNTYIRDQRNVAREEDHTDGELKATHEDDSNRNLSDIQSPFWQRRMSRRQFLTGSLSLVLGFMVGNLMNGLEIPQALIYEGFADEIKQHRDTLIMTPNRRKIIQDLIGGFRSDFSWSANLARFVEKYDLREFKKSNTVRASIAIGSVLGVSESDWLLKAIYTDQLPGPVQIDSDILVVGSPVSDPVAKLNLEYVGTSKADLKRIANPMIDLPITYTIRLNENKQSNLTVRRYLAGEEVSSGNSSIELDGKILEPPQTDSSNWLKTDYLLLTRMPNILSKKAFVNGSEVLIVGGVHGVGTEGIKMLLESDDLLASISEQLGNSRYFQILLPVIDIDHGVVDGFRHSTAVKLGKPVVRKIEIDADKLFSRWLLAGKDG